MTDGFEQIFADNESPFLVDCCARNDLVVRFEFAAVKTGQKVPNSSAKCTRMYVGAGWNGDPVARLPHGASRLYRTDCLQAANADDLTTDDNDGWLSLSSPNPADPGYGSYYFCQNGQCSYDMFVVSPPGKPNTVVPRRLDALRRAAALRRGARHLQRARRDPLDGRRRALDGHDG